MEVLILITTESSKTNALQVAKLLIQNKLAACVSIKPIFSTYEWDNEIKETEEFEIIIKSKSELKDDLIDFLHKMNSYKVPQILFKKYHASKEYYDWLSKTI